MERVIIYMPLLEEGTDAWRPVDAERLPGDRYRVLGESPDLDHEIWAFSPGSIVWCEKRAFSDGNRQLAAVRLAN